MPLVNGTLTDFGLDPLTLHDPLLQFRATAPGVQGMNILTAAKAVETVPADNGFFEVDLAATETIFPGGVQYAVTIQHREPRTGYIKRELLPWQLSVPAEGGALADLLRVPSNPAAVWIGAEAPENPTPGTWWFNTTTGDLSEWS